MSLGPFQFRSTNREKQQQQSPQQQQQQQNQTIMNPQHFLQQYRKKQEANINKW